MLPAVSFYTLVEMKKRHPVIMILQLMHHEAAGDVPRFIAVVQYGMRVGPIGQMNGKWPAYITLVGLFELQPYQLFFR